jgi:hypothetical protein
MSDSAALVRPEPLPRLSPEHLAAAGFLARYAGRTRDAYALDLRTFFGWCCARPGYEKLSPTTRWWRRGCCPNVAGTWSGPALRRSTGCIRC